MKSVKKQKNMHKTSSDAQTASQDRRAEWEPAESKMLTVKNKYGQIRENKQRDGKSDLKDCTRCRMQ